MNREEYLEKLSMELRKVPKEDRDDILSDYEEHFLIGMEKGRSEEEISKALGNPRKVARQMKVEHIIKNAENEPSVGSIIEAVLAVTGLGLFNLIFVAGPVLAIVAVLISLFITGIGVIFAGIFATLSPLLQLFFPNSIHLPARMGIMGIIEVILGGIALTIGGVILAVIVAYIAKWFYDLLIKYLKLNLKAIRRRTNKLS